MIQKYGDWSLQGIENHISAISEFSHMPTISSRFWFDKCDHFLFQKMEEAKVDTISSLNLDPTNKEALSMIARLFSSQTIDEVMESDFAQLVIEALQSVLTEKAQSFGNFENIQGIHFIRTKIITSFLFF